MRAGALAVSLVSLFALAGADGPAPLDTRLLVSSGSFWKYRDNGQDLGTAWRAPAFDDQGWPSGRSKLGYGDANEATLVGYGPDANNRYITTYFRRPFHIAAPEDFAALELAVLRDDGAVVYLNGVEVFRSNMPAGTITATTPAANGVGDADEVTWFRTAVPPSALVPGRNVLAVEVHQINGTSSDLAFDLELRGTLAKPPQPEVRMASIGDFGSNTAGEAAVANLVHSWNPDYVFTVGDNTYWTGTIERLDERIGQYYSQYIFRYIGVHGPGSETLRFIPALGNHDYDEANGQAHFDYFTLPGNERYFDVQMGPVHLFILNSEPQEPDGNTADSAQGNWAQTRIRGSEAPWQIASFHRPPYSSSTTHGNTAHMQWPFRSWGIDALFTGHDHTYERIAFNGTPYFVNGLGGAEIYGIGTPIVGSAFRYNATFGAMLLEATGDTLASAFINQNGDVVDTWSLHRPRSPFVMDGMLDPDAAELASNGVSLHAKRKGDWLYVAATAFSGNDAFLYVAREPGALRPANWAKNGQVAAWDFFLATERDNQFVQWFDATELQLEETPGFWSALRHGGVLEGAIHLPTAFGETPEELSFALGTYATQSGGALDTARQAPAPVTANGNIEANEYTQFNLRTSRWEVR